MLTFSFWYCRHFLNATERQLVVASHPCALLGHPAAGFHISPQSGLWLLRHGSARLPSTAVFGPNHRDKTPARSTRQRLMAAFRLH
jgi:hypothetical protein